MNEKDTEFNAPIIEAVVDIDCDLPPDLDFEGLREKAGDLLRNRYPKFRQQFLQHHVVSKEEGDVEPQLKVNKGLGAMQFLTDDELQLVQFRPNGFSFNRLAPYSSFDDYLPEIEAGWADFRKLCQPVVIRKIGIRMINRVKLPLAEGRVQLEEYLKVPPRLPETGSPLIFHGLLEQHMAIDSESKNRVNIVKTTESPKDGFLPLILDIDTFRPGEEAPSDWHDISCRLKSLRDLKNRIFQATLTDRCLNLFSQPAS